MKIELGTKELEKQLNKKYVPIESPIATLIKYFKNKKKRKKQEEIENLKLDIQRTKLEKELKEI